MKALSPWLPPLLCALALISCSRASEPRSRGMEGIDANNHFSRLKVDAAPTLDDILPIKSVKLDSYPWTDTYWPHTMKGLSRRWDMKNPYDETDPTNWPAAFFTSHGAAALDDIQINPLLSPAEKYDMLFRWRHRRPLDPSELKEKVAALQDIEDRIHSGADVAARRSAVGSLYTEFTQRDASYFNRFFPMAADGWSNWLNYTRRANYRYFNIADTGEDWDWMGYCHGWAPAALMAETPRHAVLVRFGSQEILLSEGDIRGLLSKSWADHSPGKSQFFLGRRCNKNVKEVEGAIPHGESGKGLYGTLKLTADDAPRDFYMKAEYFAAFAGPRERVYPISFDKQDGAGGFLLERYNANQMAYTYAFATSLDRLKDYVEGGSMDGITLPDSVELYGCWDVNPATFHVALLQKIGKEKVGFAIDRTRTGQVWNQPVYDARFKFSSPVLASDANDPAAAYRAPGTKYLMEVTTNLRWTSEPGRPSFSYGPGFDQSYLETSRYTYTLEFDRSKRLIGGEWGKLGQIDPKQVVPDFIFGFDKGSKPLDDLGRGFDYSGIIAKIHACSLSTETDGSLKVGQQNIAYKLCSLEQTPE